MGKDEDGGPRRAALQTRRHEEMGLPSAQTRYGAALMDG